MTNWKIPAGFAAFGSLVSLLAGIIGGNPFGVILLRLVLSAVVCAGLGLIVNVILKKYLPELSTSTAPARVDAATGGEVDIVIDEDIPIEVEGLVQEVAEPEEEQAEEEAELVLDEEGMDEESEQMEVLPEETGTLEPSDEQAPDSTAVPLSPVTDFEDLDTLPDIDQFGPAAEEPSSAPKESRRNAQVEEVVKDQDPENLARAVRTFMKKDQ
jgi:hypothetical protein